MPPLSFLLPPLIDMHRYQHLGDMMSLGAANAAVALPLSLPTELGTALTSSPLGPLLAAAGVRLAQPGAASDSDSSSSSSGGGGGGGAGVTLEGPVAQLLRRAAYLYRQPTTEQRLSVAASWLQQAADTAQGMAAELARGQQQGGSGVGGSSSSSSSSSSKGAQ
jgi:demethylphylloquinone reductase